MASFARAVRALPAHVAQFGGNGAHRALVVEGQQRWREQGEQGGARQQACANHQRRGRRALCGPRRRGRVDLPGRAPG
eukprot:9496199-Pyramimonas_sp.AAC.1